MPGQYLIRWSVTIGIMLLASLPAARAQDAYEPDDAIGQASNIVAGVPQSHLFTNWWDNDWVMLTTTSNRPYRFGMTNLNAGNVWGSLSLYDTTGTNQMETGDNLFGQDTIWLSAFWSGTGGVYYAKAVADAGGTDPGPYWMVVIDYGTGDVYEIDNTFAAASNIVAGVASSNHTLHWPSDVDCFKFTNTANHFYRISVTNNNVSGTLTLVDTNGTTTLQSDDPSLGGDGIIRYTLGATGTYFISMAATSATGAYELIVLDLGVVPADPYEPDDSVGTASNIVVGVSQTNRTLHWAGDLDYIRFTGTQYHLYAIQVTNVSEDLDAVLKLYGASGSNLLDSADLALAGGGEGLTNFATNSGSFYMAVTGYTDSAIGAYHASVTDLGTGDPYEYDNAWNAASNLAVGASLTNHTLHWSGDDDYIRFTNQAYHLYVIAVTNVATSVQVTVRLYDASGTSQLVSKTGSSAGSPVIVTNFPFTDSSRYIRVTAAAGTGAYSVAVQETDSLSADPYEADNTLTAAVIMAVDTIRTNGTIHQTNDVDYFKFNARGPCYYRIETTNLALGLDTVIYLYDTTGTNLLASDNNSGGGLASRLEYKIPSPGWHYIKVASSNSASAGRYELRLTDLRVRQQWRLNNIIDTSPVVADDGTIYIGTQGSRVYALTQDGSTAREWNVTGYMTSPTLDTNGTIYVGASVGANAFYALNPNGATNWTSQPGSPVYSTAALGANGNVYLPAATLFLSLRSAQVTNCITNWTASPSVGISRGSCPAIATNGAIYLGSAGGNFYSYSPTGAVIRTWTLDGAINTAPAIGSNGWVYVPTTNGTLYALDPDTGVTNRLWQLDGYTMYSSPVIAPDGTVYLAVYRGVFGAYTGRLYACTANATNLLVTITNVFFSTPALGADGVIYIGSRDKFFYAFNTNGTTNYVWYLGSTIDSSPVIDSNGVVYVGTQNPSNMFYALYGPTNNAGGFAQDC
ncbi:MAG: PQQ-binding-like beta-propeller repeat protein, partial [Lentisphaerae bacterium]|nr:PQQ-binding-like beta-propeller repeat protein [Lentisphaerota bacterium]